MPQVLNIDQTYEEPLTIPTINWQQNSGFNRNAGGSAQSTPVANTVGRPSQDGEPLTIPTINWKEAAKANY